jgi:peptidoglycan hydrolase CwlO-like protein
MIQLYTALIHANIPEHEAKNVLTELENTIHNDIERELLQMNVSTINPIVREQDGIRSDIRQLSITLENEVEALNTKIHTEIEKLNTKIDTGLEKLNTKIDTVEERLNAKIDAVEDRLNAKIDAVEERLNAKIDAVEDRLNAKIDSVEANLTSKFKFHDKLLWTIISLLIALSGFVVTNSILLYQKLK